ncbi:MAG: hypothetical protein AAFS10_00715, partial [Myxococcota bacterium]
MQAMGAGSGPRPTRPPPTRLGPPQLPLNPLLRRVGGMVYTAAVGFWVHQGTRHSEVNGMVNEGRLQTSAVYRWAVVVMLVWMAAACGDEGGSTTSPETMDQDTGLGDAGASNTAEPDTTEPDTTEPDTGPMALPDTAGVVEPEVPPFETPPPAESDAPVAPAAELEPLEASWWVAFVSSPNTRDPVADALEAGTFTAPQEPGPGQEGANWSAAELGEGGTLPSSPFGLVYGAAQVDVPEGRRLVVRADRVLSVFANGRQQPGDVYGSVGQRFALIHTPGEPVTVVLQGYGQRGAPAVELFTTPDELVFNPSDTTSPTPVEGDTSTQFLGMQIVVARPEPVIDLVARVLPNDDFEESWVRYTALPGGSSTQVGFELIPARPMPEAESTVEVRLRLSSPSLEAS